MRETSRKPDEIYGIIERLSPGTKKLGKVWLSEKNNLNLDMKELFGRQHNIQPGWITLGNQLEDTYIVDPEIKSRMKARNLL